MCYQYTVQSNGKSYQQLVEFADYLTPGEGGIIMSLFGITISIEDITAANTEERTSTKSVLLALDEGSWTHLPTREVEGFI